MGIQAPAGIRFYPYPIRGTFVYTRGMGLAARFGFGQVARAISVGTRCAIASDMPRAIDLENLSELPVDHIHETLFRKTVVSDETGSRVIETCACGAQRVIDRWAAMYRLPVTPITVAALASQGSVLSPDGVETSSWYRFKTERRSAS
jgi:hypothetical protein